jgi:hypothetical protein
VDQGQAEEALECFERMEGEGIAFPNSATLLCAVKACGSIGAMNKAHGIHRDVEARGLFGTDIGVGNSLVDTYTKCGSLAAAQQVFEKLPIRDAVSWNSILAGYANGVENRGDDVRFMFGRMLAEGVQPNSATFVILQHAFDRFGLFRASQTWYESMSKDFGILPAAEHHSAMVSVLCKQGQLPKAVAMVSNMPELFKPRVWRMVLSACSKSSNAEVGQLAFEHAVCDDALRPIL